MLYVTHDLGVLAQIADRVGVMYAGHMVETAATRELFAEPRHPYTRGLIASVPQIERTNRRSDIVLRGLLKRELLPIGCPFQPRCDFADAKCEKEIQNLERISPDHEVACRQVARDCATSIPGPGGARSCDARHSTLNRSSALRKLAWVMAGGTGGHGLRLRTMS